MKNNTDIESSPSEQPPSYEVSAYGGFNQQTPPMRTNTVPTTTGGIPNRRYFWTSAQDVGNNQVMVSNRGRTWIMDRDLYETTKEKEWRILKIVFIGTGLAAVIIILVTVLAVTL